MPDGPDTLKPRRRWKRRATLTLVLGIGCGVWMTSGESETIQRSRQLRVGQTTAEVEAIMGTPVGSGFTQIDAMTYNPIDEVLYFATPSEVRQYRCVLWLHRQLAWFGQPPLWSAAKWPVEVHFDASGHSQWFRRGFQIVGP